MRARKLQPFKRSPLFWIAIGVLSSWTIFGLMSVLDVAFMAGKSIFQLFTADLQEMDIAASSMISASYSDIFIIVALSLGHWISMIAAIVALVKRRYLGAKIFLIAAMLFIFVHIFVLPYFSAAGIGLNYSASEAFAIYFPYLIVFAILFRYAHTYLRKEATC